jgi:hypothetical protein
MTNRKDIDNASVVRDFCRVFEYLELLPFGNKSTRIADPYEGSVVEFFGKLRDYHSKESS